MCVSRVLHRSQCLLLTTIVGAVLAMLALATSANSDAIDLARKGLAAKERREFALAIQLFDQALTQGTFEKKDRGLLTYSRGVSYEELGMHDKALADLDAAIALIPDFPNAYIYRGLVWTD